ncbi:MAG: DUF1294 domain-containing protein [Paludibacteraceae bacterium]|nr:DUF1294 domain-containing protein [Paludibacteraceae bacterium]
MSLEFVFLLLFVWNLVVFAVYAIDKYKARRNKWRIPEKTLVLLAFLGGAFGALAGMYSIRHKTKHLKFQILVPLAAVLNCIALFCLVK